MTLVFREFKRNQGTCYASKVTGIGKTQNSNNNYLNKLKHTKKFKHSFNTKGRKQKAAAVKQRPS